MSGQGRYLEAPWQGDVGDLLLEVYSLTDDRRPNEFSISSLVEIWSPLGDPRGPIPFPNPLGARFLGTTHRAPVTQSGISVGSSGCKKGEDLNPQIIQVL